MKVKYLNVSSFLITTETGVRIITDPYQHNYIPAGDPPPDYNPDRPGITEFADVITISHTHANNSYIWAIKGVPQIYTGGEAAEIKGVRFYGVTTNHMYNHRENIIICSEADGIRIWHMGDFGQPELSDEQLGLVGRVDILMTPWNDTTPAILRQLKPKVVFPMKDARVDDYMERLKGFKRMGNVSELEFTADTLPPEMHVIMLKPALP